jgi:tetratricopeptide (TPR) repeat protein
MMDSFAMFSSQGLRPALFQQLAQHATENNDLKEATEFLEKAIELDPENRNSYANLFMLNNRAGLRDQAIQSLERYLRKFPQDTTVKAELEKYRAGGAFDVEGIFGARP